MDANQPGLFEIPDRKPLRPPTPPQRGRNRETWARTATAEVTIIDPSAVRDAAAHAQKVAATIGLRGTARDEDAEAGPPGTQANCGSDALLWLVWPTDGFEDLSEAGAVRILSMGTQADLGSDDRGTISWTVTVKFMDVQELRRIAAHANPEAAESIANSLEIAWQFAADPFTPLRSIPGIRWQPGPVDVHHLPRRRAGMTEAT